MSNIKQDFCKGKPGYVGIDVHKRDYLPPVRWNCQCSFLIRRV